MIKREKIEQKESLNKNVLAELVNFALASSKIENITLEQEEGDFITRGNINLFIYGQIASTKSTLLNQISDKAGCKAPFTDLSYPALIGSVDGRTTQLMVGASWECRNSLLLLDEFDFGKRNKDDIRALLQLIEGGKYNKKMCAFSATNEEEDGDLYYKYRNGEFNIKTRFSLILVTMKYPYTSQSQELQALITRSIAIPWYPSREDLKKIGQGHSLFKFVEKNKNFKTRVKKKDYDFIYNYVFDKTQSSNALRIICDCCRIFVIEGKHRQDIYDLIIKLGSKEFQSKPKKEKKNEKTNKSKK